MSVATLERPVSEAPDSDVELMSPEVFAEGTRRRVLVTGSRGTLGRPLVVALREAGYEVYGCGRSHSDADNYTRADVSYRPQLDWVFRQCRPHFVYHLAAEFGRHNGEQYYEQLWRSNVVGTRNVLECCAHHVAPMIFASSSEVYGEGFPHDQVLHEELVNGADPQQAPVHSNEYAISKFTNELQIGNFARRTGLEVLVARFFNAYGPGELYNPYRSVVSQFVYKALVGQPWDVYEGYSRTFMHIDDFVPTLARMSTRFRPGVYNVGGTDYRAVSELSDLVIETVGCDPGLARPLPREKHNVVSKRPDISRAQRDFGHDPRITLETGIPDYVEWMRDWGSSRKHIRNLD